jgi:hypothetical protein
VCYVVAKAAVVFGAAPDGAVLGLQGKGQLVAVEAMFLMSLALAAAHIAMAYRASCRERRRLLVYRIDVEAVSDRFPFFARIVSIVSFTESMSRPHKTEKQTIPPSCSL